MNSLRDTVVDTSGSTLIENVVALALLLSVILPAGVFLGDLTLKRPAALRSEAVALARSEMELLRGTDSDCRESTRVLDRFKIEVVSTPSIHGELLSIRVYRRGSDRTLVHLSTFKRTE